MSGSVEGRTKSAITATRLHRWCDMNEIVDGAYATRYGVQVKVEGKWRHLAIANEAAIFKTPEEALVAADTVMRRAAP